jgi:hypothetical protein
MAYYLDRLNTVSRGWPIHTEGIRETVARTSGSSRERPITDVEYEPTPQKVVDALLRLAKVTNKDVVWYLGYGDGRIPVTAAKEYACKACGFRRPKRAPIMRRT